uniref:Myb-like domain-containing protein n=1 Tax=Oryza glumipatula TaxID=40148 RepID=A0A0D9Y3T9_9ORYZ
MVRKPTSSRHGEAAGGGGGAAEEKERKGLWSPEEDERLYTHITHRGVSTWSSVAQLAGKNSFCLACNLIDFYATNSYTCDLVSRSDKVGIAFA